MILQASAVEGTSLCMKDSVVTGSSQLMYVIISCHMQYINEHVSVYLDDGRHSLLSA